MEHGIALTSMDLDVMTRNLEGQHSPANLYETDPEKKMNGLDWSGTRHLTEGITWIIIYDELSLSIRAFSRPVPLGTVPGRYVSIPP